MQGFVRYVLCMLVYSQQATSLLSHARIASMMKIGARSKPMGSLASSWTGIVSLIESQPRSADFVFKYAKLSYAKPSLELSLLTVHSRQILIVRYNDGRLPQGYSRVRLRSMLSASLCGCLGAFFSSRISRAAARPQLLHLQGRVNQVQCFLWCT